MPWRRTPGPGGSWEPRWAVIDGFEMWLDLVGGQKTGFYLDQRLQHPAVARYCQGKRVLDAFCNQGSFAIHAARAGAAEVLGLDSAGEAVDAARRNAERNRVKATFEVANVFDWLNDPANKPGTPVGRRHHGPSSVRKVKVGARGRPQGLQGDQPAGHAAARAGWHPRHPIPAPTTCRTRSSARCSRRRPPMPGGASGSSSSATSPPTTPSSSRCPRASTSGGTSCRVE